mgnify:CR=1 FL=1
MKEVCRLAVERASSGTAAPREEAAGRAQRQRGQVCEVRSSKAGSPRASFLARRIGGLGSPVAGWYLAIWAACATSGPGSTDVDRGLEPRAVTRPPPTIKLAKTKALPKEIFLLIIIYLRKPPAISWRCSIERSAGTS